MSPHEGRRCESRIPQTCLIRKYVTTTFRCRTQEMILSPKRRGGQRQNYNTEVIMSPYRKNLLVGVMMLGGLIVLGWMILQFGDAPIAFLGSEKVKVRFIAERA